MGTPEILMIAVIVLVLFGGAQIPKIARNLGQAQRELKKGLEEGRNDAKPSGED